MRENKSRRVWAAGTVHAWAGAGGGSGLGSPLGPARLPAERRGPCPRAVGHTHTRRSPVLWVLSSACPYCPPLGPRPVEGSPPAVQTEDQSGGPSPRPHAQLGQARKKQKPVSDPPGPRELRAEKSPREEGDQKRDSPQCRACQEHGPHEPGGPAEEGGGAGRGWESGETDQGAGEARKPGRRVRAEGTARAQLLLRVLQSASVTFKGVGGHGRRCSPQQFLQ